MCQPRTQTSVIRSNRRNELVRVMVAIAIRLVARKRAGQFDGQVEKNE